MNLNAVTEGGIVQEDITERGFGVRLGAMTEKSIGSAFSMADETLTAFQVWCGTPHHFRLRAHVMTYRVSKWKSLLLRFHMDFLL